MFFSADVGLVWLDITCYFRVFHQDMKKKPWIESGHVMDFPLEVMMKGNLLIQIKNSFTLSRFSHAAAKPKIHKGRTSFIIQCDRDCENFQFFVNLSNFLYTVLFKYLTFILNSLYLHYLSFNLMDVCFSEKLCS